MTASPKLQKHPAIQPEVTTASPGAGFGAKDWALLAVILALGLAMYLPRLGSFGPLDPTDSFFIESGREMIETGNYIVPIDNYQPWLDKPILSFWMIAGVYKLLGVSPFAGRLHSAVASILMGLLMYGGTRPFLNRRAAFLGAIIFLSYPLVSIIGHVSLVDMPLALFITGAMLGIAHGAINSSTRGLALGYVSLGLAVLNKGPIAAILCGLALLSWTALTVSNREEWLASLKKLRPLLGCAILLAINLPWYSAAMIHTSGAFFYDFFIRQNFGRMVGTVNHQEKWYFYIPVFFGGLAPWCLYLFSAPSQFKRAWGLRLSMDRQARFFLLCACWAVVVLALFGSLKTKLPTYILPAFPAIAILTAVQVDAIMRSGRAKHMLFLTIATFIAALIFLAIRGHLHGYLHDVVINNLVILAIMPVLLAAHCVLLATNRVKAAMTVFALASIGATGPLVPLGLVEFHKYHQAGFDRLILKTKQDGARLAILIAEQPTAPYVLHRAVPRIATEEDAASYMKGAQAGTANYVVVPRTVVKDLRWFGSKSSLIAKDGKWSLYAVE